MPTPIYDLIEEKVLSSAQASVTFSSIPGTYKDLVVECIFAGFSASGNLLGIQFNGDTTTNYSGTGIIGNGTNATSSRYSTVNRAPVVGFSNGTGTGLTTAFVQIMSYTSTSVYKTTLARGNDSASQTEAAVGLWRKTPEAITSLTLLLNGTVTISSGSTFRLWGIA